MSTTQLPFKNRLCLALMVACAAAAQPLAVEELAKIKEIGTVLKTSPDGRLVAYEVIDWGSRTETYHYASRTGTPAIGIAHSVWVIDVESGQARNLTENQGNNWGPSWSPDGKYLAYYSDRNHKPQLWLWDVAKDSTHLAAEAMVRPFSAMDTVQWTPDSKKILVKLVPEGMSQDELYKLNNPQQARDNQDAGKSDTSKITVYSSNASADPHEAAATRRGQADSVTNSYLSDLAVIHVPDGKVERIAKRVKPTWYEFSPKGDQIAFADAKGAPEGDVYHFAYDLELISLAEGTTRTLARGIRSNAILIHTITWSPDGTSLAYTGTDATILTDRGGYGSRHECYIVSVSSGRQRLAATGPHPSFEGDGMRAPLWSANGRSLFLLAGNAVWAIDAASGSAREVGKVPGKDLTDIVAMANDSQAWAPDGGDAVAVLTRDASTKDSGFYRMNAASGASTKLLEQNKAIRSSGKLFRNVSSDGKKLIYVAEDTAHPSDVWIADANFHNPRRLTNINPNLLNLPMGAGKLVEWRNDEGEVLRGALLLPADYQKGKRYPLIVRVYGGQQMSDFLNDFGLARVWFSNHQLFATRGYAVLTPDMPLRVGSPMRDIAGTVLPGIDKAIEMGIADPNRVGVMGLSFGGYCVLSLIVQSKIFKAAVMHAGEGDLFTAYGEMNEDGVAGSLGMIEKGPFRMGGTPWEYRDRYIENSPFFYLDRVETPLLITHGDSDDRVPAFLGEQTFVSLRRLGKEVTYVKYHGEGHVMSTYANKADELNRTIAWFDDHLKKLSPAR